MTNIKTNKLTTVLVVETIEPSLDFWRARLGFTVTIEVPHGDKLGFVALENDGLEVMLQTRKSLTNDMAGAAKAAGPTLLYLEVDDLEEVIAALHGVPVAVQRRRAFYGADEIAFHEPGGHIVCFSRPA